MAEHIEASYKPSLRDAEDGDLVLVITEDGAIQPGIKGTNRDRPFVTVLAERVALPSGNVLGPFVMFGEFECLSLGRNFVLDFDPVAPAFPQDGQLELGRLLVADGGMFIRAHAESGASYANIADGSLNKRQPAVAFRAWSISLRRTDGSLQQIYRRNA